MYDIELSNVFIQLGQFIIHVITSVSHSGHTWEL